MTCLNYDIWSIIMTKLNVMEKNVMFNTCQMFRDIILSECLMCQKCQMKVIVVSYHMTKWKDSYEPYLCDVLCYSCKTKHGYLLTFEIDHIDDEEDYYDLTITCDQFNYQSFKYITSASVFHPFTGKLMIDPEKLQECIDELKQVKSYEHIMKLIFNGDEGMKEITINKNKVIFANYTYEHATEVVIPLKYIRNDMIMFMIRLHAEYVE
jgi:hypothetical protein